MFSEFAFFPKIFLRTFENVGLDPPRGTSGTSRHPPQLTALEHWRKYSI